MTDVMMIQSNNKYSGNNPNQRPAANVFGISSSASSSCEETESVKDSTNDSDDNLDDFDKLHSGVNQMPDEDGDMDEDNLSVSSKTHSTCSSSKPSNINNSIDSKAINGGRRKQNKPIRIQDEIKDSKEKKSTIETATSNTESGVQVKEEAVDIKETNNNEHSADLKKEPRISAKIADLLINNKLEQIAKSTVFDQSPKSPKVNSMETFCTICKKEVCNKYFLKTHLLNKHNVQIEDYLAAQAAGIQPSSTGSISSASSSSSASSTSSIYENTLEQQLHLTQKLLNQTKKSTASNNPSAELLANLSKQAANSTDLKISPTKQLAALASMLATQNNQANQPDEEIFQTKYNDQENNQTEAILSLLNLGKNKSQTAPLAPPAGTDSSNLFNHYFNIAMQQQQQGQRNLLGSMNDSMNMSGLKSTTANNSSTEDFCDICQKQFCNKYYLKKHKIDVHGINDQKPQGTTKVKNALESVTGTGTPDLTQILMNQLNPLMQMANAQLTQSSPSPSISSASSSSLSSNTSNPKQVKQEATTADTQQKADKDSKISVMQKVESNNEVTCPHCTKVFYNTEFLALHVQNKHGIKIDDLKINSDKENSSLLESTTQKISQLLTNSPLPVLNNRPNVESPLIHNQPFCQYCNKSFCNKYFLRTHMLKAHGKTLIIENNKNDNEELNDSDATHFASKVVDRVVCDICNKQVCNKYFLRTHKMRVHGLNPRNKTYFSNNDNSHVSLKDTSSYQNDETEYNEQDYDYDEDMGMAGSDGEEGELQTNGFNESEEVEPTELGEMVKNQPTSSTKDIQQRRGSTCSNNSNLSILTTSSTHNNAQPVNNNMNNANPITKAKELSGFGNYNGASPISSTSSFSLNSPSSADLTKKGQQITNRDSYCTLCKRQFCSKYFLKNHMVKRHGLSENSEMPELEDEDQMIGVENQSGYLNDEKNNTLNLPNDGHYDSPGSAMARVSCIICKKNVCNKYFLRQHVQQRHKITFETYVDKFGLDFSKKSARGRTASIPNNYTSQGYYNSEEEKLKDYMQNKNQKVHKSGDGDEESSLNRKRKYSGSSSCESYDTLSSSSNFNQQEQQSKKSRAQFTDDTNMFSDQLLTLTNSAEEEGFSELQAFIIESDDGEFNEYFRPSMIYLPVKNKLGDSISLRVRLRPAAAENSYNNNTSNNNENNNNNNTNSESLLDQNTSLDQTLDNHVNSLNNLEDESLGEQRISESLECEEDVLCA